MGFDGQKTIASLGRVITGKTPSTKTEEYWNGNIPFITPKDLQGNKHIINTERSVTSKGAYSVKGSKIPINAVCVSCIGIIGYVGMTTEDSVSNQQINTIVVNEDNDADYVYYLMKWLWPFFKNYEGQSTTLSILNKTQFSQIEIPYHQTAVQKKIARFLSDIDEKIEINTAINKNLEEQAQALYDDLFADVSFDATLADLGTVVGGSTPSKKHSEYYTDQGIAWITPKDLSNDSSKFIYHGENDITELGLSKCSATVMPIGTVLFSSRAPIGYIAIAANPMATNQGFKSVIPSTDIGTAFIYYFLKNNLTIIESMASGSTFKEISAGAMKTVPAFKPDSDKLCQFRNFCEPLFCHQQLLESENARLAQLRDTLLPRLMSDEIDVSEIES